MQEDKLKRIFDIQLKTSQEVLNLDLKQKQEKTKELVLAAITELTELLAEINCFSWKKEFEVVETNIIEEAIDVEKFMKKIFLTWGVDEKRYFEEFERKSMVVEQRLKQFKVLKDIKDSGARVCAIDLDGVLVEYPNDWIRYINVMKGTKFTNLFEVKKDISNEEYLTLKHNYRISGAEEDVSLTDGALSFVQKLKDLGYSVVIITKRPYKKYFRAFADTKNNLDKHKIPYDAILFDTEKHKAIVKELPQLEFMVEDNKQIANEVGSWSYRCFLLDNIYNQGEIHKNVVRVEGFGDIIKYIKRENRCLSEV